MRAFILEDLPESQEMLVAMTHQAFPGIESRCFQDVRGALAATKNDWQLALIDLSLPDGSGIEVIHALSTHCPACISVVTTIYEDDAHLFPALQAGAQGYLLKDEEPDLLVQQLRGIYEGRPPLSPSIARRILQHFHSAPSERTAPTALSPREREVLGLLARGMSIAAIAGQLGISTHTAGDHVKNIYRKLKISSRAEAALHAKKMGLT